MKILVCSLHLSLVVLWSLIRHASAQEAEQVFTNSVGIKFVLIENSEKRKLWAQQDELSISQFADFASDSGYTSETDLKVAMGALHPSENWRSWVVEQGDYPVRWITFEDAVKYCQWISKKEKRNYRLPTEQEWELLSPEKKDHIQDDSKETRERVNIKWDKRSLTECRAANQGRLNSRGIRNVIGNVEEFTDSLFFGKSDEKPSSRVSQKVVLRGGSWKSNRDYITEGGRGWISPNLFSNSVGFRVFMDDATSNDINPRSPPSGNQD